MTVALAGLLGAGMYLQVGIRLQGVADQAALEAADTRSGRLPGDACSRVRSLVQEAHAQVVTCTVFGLESRIQLRTTLGALVLHAKAHAGPSRNAPNLTSR